MPAFSVIIPTFNRADLLPRCVESVFRQTFGDFEIVVADDGSTDDTRSVVEDFAARDGRIRYVYQENRGAGDARNLGVSVSNGRFIAFIDSDDEVAPTWLQRFHDKLKESDVYVACCGQRLIDHNGELKKRSIPNKQGLFISGSFAIRRAAFEAVGRYAPALPASQHTELKYRLLPLCERNGWRIATIDEPLAIRHLHNGASIRTNYKAVYESCLYILREHEQHLRINPRNYANWATLCAMSAVQLKRFRNARFWLRRAVWTCPGNWRSLARLAVVSTPLLRSVAWRKPPNTDL